MRAWPIVDEGSAMRAGAASSEAVSRLVAEFRALAGIPEVHLRLAVAAAIQAVAEELALCPGATPRRLIWPRAMRALQNLVRPELRDIRGRAWAFGIKFIAGDEGAIEVCQLLFGNWIARQVGFDHHSDENAALLWELGRIALVEGVAITEDALTQVAGRPS